MYYQGGNYLAVISNTQQVGTINKAKIMKVTGVKILPFVVSLSLKSFDVVVVGPCS